MVRVADSFLRSRPEPMSASLTETAGQAKGTTLVDEFFSTQHLKTDLKGRSVRGGAVTMAAQGARFVLRMVSTVVLARLLTPEDFGIFAMVLTVTGFVAMFKDMGLSMATVQRVEINHRQISTLFWINVGLSLCVMLVTAALAPAIALFYGEPRLTWITLALACAFIFGGLTVQHQALLRRQMRFGTLALIQIGSMGAGIVTGIIAALCAAGYWALVFMELATVFAGALGVWVACGWRPGLPVRKAGVRSMVAFGGHLTGYNVVNYFGRNLDNVLLGRFWGANVLGLYSRAYNIMMLPIIQVREPLHAVAIPALSHLQKDPIRYKSYYIRLITLISFVTMPLMVVLFLCADDVIHLFLGDQWLGAINIYRVLCIVAFIQPVGSTWGIVLVSLGQSGRYFRWGIVSSAVIIISFICGLQWGAVGVGTAYTIANYLLLIPTLSYCFRQTPISAVDFFLAISRPVIASIVMGFVIVLSRLYLPSLPNVWSISCSFVVGFATYLMVLLLVPGGYLLLQEFYSYRSFLSPKSA